MHRLAPLALVGLWTVVFPQEEIQSPEELDYITLDRPTMREEILEDEFEDLIFDETTQQYRLINDKENNNEEKQ